MRLKHVAMHQFAITVLSFGVRACVGLPLLLRHFVGRFAVPIGFSVCRRPNRGQHVSRTTALGSRLPHAIWCSALLDSSAPPPSYP
jgi:hypothetical protein